MISLSGGGENGEEYIVDVETADEDDSGSAFKPSSFFRDDIIKKTTKK